MRDAYLAGRRRGGGGADVGWGGGRTRLLVLNTVIVDRAADGSLWLAEGCPNSYFPLMAQHRTGTPLGRCVQLPPEASPWDDPLEEEDCEDEESQSTKS